MFSTYEPCIVHKTEALVLVLHDNPGTRFVFDLFDVYDLFDLCYSRRLYGVVVFTKHIH